MFLYFSREPTGVQMPQKPFKKKNTFLSQLSHELSYARLQNLQIAREAALMMKRLKAALPTIVDLKFLQHLVVCSIEMHHVQQILKISLQ